MDSNSVCGIVVTYHPDAGVLTNLTALRAQVQHLIVVDNGSNPDELSPLRSAASTLPFDVGGFDLLENRENLGIAAALNTAVHRAQALGFPWVLLFDQDSQITPGFTQTMLHAFAVSPAGTRLAIVNPRYVDSRFNHVLEPFLCVNGQLETAITSGSLMPVTIFRHAGYFAEELFIDGVDYEYSFRVRTLGYTIERCAEATVLHSPGTPTYHSFLGGKPFQVSNYTPIRRYYQERNKIYIARRYWPQFRIFLLLQFRIGLKDFVKILIAEDDKLRKIRFFLRGILDGFRGRMGKLAP